MRRYRDLAVRCNRPERRRALLGSIVAAITLIALLAAAAGADASTIGPFELSGGALPAVQVPSLLGMGQAITQPQTSAGYGSGGRGAPSSVSVLTITKKVDASSNVLAHALTLGTHYKKGSLALVNGGGTYEAICLTDALPVSSQVQSGGRLLDDA